jgi:hypothetical protein
VLLSGGRNGGALGSVWTNPLLNAAGKYPREDAGFFCVAETPKICSKHSEKIQTGRGFVKRLNTISVQSRRKVVLQLLLTWSLSKTLD